MFRLFILLTALAACTPSPLPAQKCSEISEYFREGVLVEYTHYDKKGRAETISTHRMKRLETVNDTLVAHADITVRRVKDNKEISTTSMPIKCHQGTVFFSMRNFVPSPESAQTPEMQVEFSGSDLAYPSSFTIGQTLPDSEMEITTRMGSLTLMKNRFAIKDRHVEAKEAITTPAGTFTCYKISYNLEYQMLGTRTSRAELWYSPAVGTVRSITYDSKGREEGRMELTKFSR